MNAGSGDDFEILYAEWEARDYSSTLIKEDKINIEAFFYQDDYPPIKKDIIPRIYYFLSKIFKVIWSFTLRPVMRYISRSASGLSKPITIGKTHGYFGWGVIIMLQPKIAPKRLKDELINISIVAALLLTLTLPILVSPPLNVCNDSSTSNSYDEYNCNILNPIFLLVAGCAVWAQVVVTSTATMIITCLNKCMVDNSESGNYLIKCIFNPDYGLTGFIGPALYLGVTTSYALTLWTSFILVVSNFQEHPPYIWIMYFAIIIVMFGAYIIALSLGRISELKIKKREFEKIKNFKGSNLTDKLDTYHKMHKNTEEE